MPLSIKEETADEYRNIIFGEYEDSKIEILENNLDESETVESAFSEIEEHALLNNLQINHIKNEQTIPLVVNENSNGIDLGDEIEDKMYISKDTDTVHTAASGHFFDINNSNRESNLSNVSSSGQKNNNVDDFVPSSLKSKPDAKNKTKQANQESSCETGSNEKVVEFENGLQKSAARCNIEKELIISVILERNALCEEKTYEKMLNTREKLFVCLRQDNLCELQKQHNDIQVETKENGRAKWHRWSSNQPNRFWCRLCPFTASNRCALMIHIVENHKELAAKRKIAPVECMSPGKDPNIIWYKCLECAFITKSVYLHYSHSFRHKPDELQTLSCAHCPFQTKWRAYLINHLTIHRATCHKCKLCDFQTKRLKYMKKHVRMIHKTEEVELLKCKKCTFQTKYKESLKKHSLIHSDVRKMYKCSLCPFQTPYMEVLKYSHTIRHKSDEEARIHKCEFCPYKGKTRGELSRHKLRHKSFEELKMHKCGICPFQTRHKYYINRHRLTHQIPDEDNMHPCNLCSYQGRSAMHLLLHKKVHTGPEECKMFKCEICPYQSKVSTNLKRHSLQHKNGDELALFQCDKCEYHGNSKDRLRTHYNNVHKNPADINWKKCSECDYQTKHQGNLKRHMLCHMDPDEAKKFKCDSCPFRAKTKNEVKSHMVMHSNVFLKCDQCNYQTKYYSALHHHRKQKHF